MEDEEEPFQVVSRKRAIKNIKTNHTAHIRIDGSFDDIEKTMKECMKSIETTGFGKFVEKLIATTSKAKDIECIIIIGNGHFDGRHEPGAHQLALCLYLADSMDIPVIFQDPVCTKYEIEWLQEKKVSIRTDRDMNIVCDQITLIFMIHSEHFLINQFIEANIDRFHNCIIIGNDYTDVNWQLNENNKKLAHIDQFVEKCKISKLSTRLYDNANNTAFTNTVIMSCQ